jgi:hypothetical protein
MKEKKNYIYDLPFKAYWLRDAPTSLIFNNRKICPHCIYVFKEVCASSLNGINNYTYWLRDAPAV